eukprot:70245_1
MMEQSLLLYLCILISFCIINATPTPPPVMAVGFTGFQWSDKEWFDEARAINKLFSDLHDRLQELPPQPAPDPTRASVHIDSKAIIDDMEFKLSQIQLVLTRKRQLRHSETSGVRATIFDDFFDTEMLEIIAGLDTGKWQHERELSKSLESTFYEPVSSMFRASSLRRRSSSGTSSSSSMGYTDEVLGWLNKIKSTSEGDTDIYKVLDTGEQAFYRIGNFPIPLNKEKTNLIHIPLYVMNRGQDYGGEVWNIYILPENLYQKVNIYNKEHGGPSLKSNKDLKAKDIFNIMFNPFDFGGAHIEVDGSAGSAEIYRIHFRKGMLPEISESEFSLLTQSVTSKVKSAVKSLFSKKKENINYKLTVAVSKAFDSLWIKWDIDKVECTDMAFIPCGDPAEEYNNPGNPAVSMIFLRVFGKESKDERISYYMKPEFGFKLDEAIGVLKVLPGYGATQREVFDNVVNNLHTTRFSAVIQEIDNSMLQERDGGLLELLETQSDLQKELDAMYAGGERLRDTMSDREKQYQKGIEALMSEIEKIKDKFKKGQDMLDNIIDMVNKQNDENTKQKYRGHARIGQDVMHMTMGEVMTMLWYQGNAPSCINYIKLFEFIYGKHDADLGITTTQYYTTTHYAYLMHQIHNAVQHLVKNPIKRARGSLSKSSKAIVAPYVQSPSYDASKQGYDRYLIPMEYYSYDLNYIYPWTMLVIYVLICLCTLGLFGCLCLLLNGFLVYILKKVQNDKRRNQCESVESIEIS